MRLDNHEVSPDDYNSFKANRESANGWADYMNERSQIHLADYAAYLRRLRRAETEEVDLTMKIHFLNLEPNLILSAVPFPEQIKQLDLSHNDLSGDLDLSRFASLEYLALSGNPSLSLADSSLPNRLRHIILSDKEENKPELANFKQKFPQILISQNGKADFRLGELPFREPEMVEVKGGKFWMGSEDLDKKAYENEKPMHRVQLSDYSIGKYPVTVEEFACFVQETPYITAAKGEGWSSAVIPRGNGLAFFCKIGCNWRHDVYGKPMDNTFARRPVIHVSWNDAKAYCNWLSQKTGRAYRLPTEAQWEYAAIGGHKAAWQDEDGYGRRKFTYAGSDDLLEVGWFVDKFEGEPLLDYGTRPVGKLKPNALGLYDISGNVWEWCADWYDKDYYQKCKEEGVVKDPSGSAQGSFRALRGGGWNSSTRDCRVADRIHNDPAHRGLGAGFRLAL